MATLPAASLKIDRIAESFLARCRDLRTGNGANFDYKAVHDGLVPDVVEDPALLVVVGTESPTVRSAGLDANSKLERVVEVYVEGRHTLLYQAPLTPRRVSTMIVADVLRAGLTDTKHGGAAISTAVASIERETQPASDEVVVAVRVTFEVRYRTRFTEPSED